MENSGDGKGTFTLKHYLFLLVWWLSLGFTLDTNSALLGLVLSFVFFAMTAMHVLKKSILIMLAVFILTAIFPPLGFAVACLALIFFLMRITFVIDNWRALSVGLYAYGIYLLVVIFNSFFYETVVVQATIRVVDFFNAGGETAVETFGQQGVDAVMPPLVLSRKLFMWVHIFCRCFWPFSSTDFWAGCISTVILQTGHST